MIFLVLGTIDNAFTVERIFVTDWSELKRGSGRNQINRTIIPDIDIKQKI